MRCRDTWSLLNRPSFPSRESPLLPPDDLYAVAPVTLAATQQPCGENWRQARLQCLNAAEVLLWWLLSVSFRPSHSISPSHPRRPPSGSPPPALLPSHGQWSWDWLKLEPQLIRHISHLSQAIICWVFQRVVLHLVWRGVHHGNLSESDKYRI